MGLSRRSFVKAAGAGGFGVLTAPLIAARGSEAARELYASELSALPRELTFAADERARARLAAPAAIRLDSNENPNGPGAAVLDAVRAMFGETPRYPDVQSADLATTIARHFNVTPDNVLTGCGSGEVLRMSVYAFTSPERALVTAAPSFEDPVKHAAITRAPVREVPVDGSLRLDLARMLDQTQNAGLVFLCNPNNPTATVHGFAAVRDFITEVNRRAPQCVILVDEAYHEYVDDPSYGTAVPLAMENPRVIAVRTFSKVFGMAGLRLGYAIGQKDTLAEMRKHRLPNNINVLSAAAGSAALPDSAHLERERQLNHAAREYTVKAFESMGYKPGASSTNFIMVPIARDAKAFKDACAKQGVLVGRAFPPLTTHARISIGTMDEMQKAVAVFQQVLSSATH
jgi:histidinol-phosphate aminotransferase